MGGAGSPAAADVTILKDIEEAEPKSLAKENLGIKPQMGVINFGDPGDGEKSRLAVGMTIDLDIMSSKNALLENWYFGPSTGFFFSKVGSETHSFILPLNFKFGYTFGRANFRLSLHGGANAIYRESIGAMELENPVNNPTQTGSGWRFFPNFGADVEVGIGRKVALLFRPDMTVTDGPEMFSGTFGVTIPLL